MSDPIPYYIQNPDDPQQTPPPLQQAPLLTIAPPAGAIPTIAQTPRPLPAQFQPNPMRQQREQQLERIAQQQENPAPVKGFWPKAGRILGDIGGIAGGLLVGPERLSLIPGTPEHRAAQQAATEGELAKLEGQDLAEEKQASESGLQGAEAAKTGEETAEMPGAEASKESLEQAEAQKAGRPDLAQAYATAVQSAMAAGGDPSADPVVQHLAAAIRAIQKEPAPKGSEHVDLVGPGGKPIAATFDPSSGQYKDSTGKVIENPQPYEKPTEGAETKNLWAVKGADGVTRVVSLKAGDTVPDGAVSLSGQSSINTKSATSQQDASQSLAYAKDYLASGNYTGPGDEALLEKYFDLAKPSSGFRMTQQQIELLQQSRSWMGSAEGEAYHAEHGTWFSDEQRQQIVDTMTTLGQAKGASGATPPVRQRPANVPAGYQYNAHGPKGAGWYAPTSK